MLVGGTSQKMSWVADFLWKKACILDEGNSTAQNTSLLLKHNTSHRYLPGNIWDFTNENAFYTSENKSYSLALINHTTKVGTNSKEKIIGL